MLHNPHRIDAGLDWQHSPLSTSHSATSHSAAPTQSAASPPRREKISQIFSKSAIFIARFSPRFAISNWNERLFDQRGLAAPILHSGCWTLNLNRGPDAPATAARC